MLNLIFVAVLSVQTSWALTPIIREKKTLARRYEQWVERQDVPQHPEAYRFIGEIHQQILPWVKSRPGVIEPMLLGRSVERRPIWGFRIHRPQDRIHTKVLVFAGIHALEWISTETAGSFIQDIVPAPPRGVEVVVVPLLNPDGRERVEKDLLEGRNVYRRGNAAQVDLNRDFEVNTEARAIWRHIIPAYYGRSETALSQPESRALDRLLASEQFDVALSLHAFGGFVYTPWSGLWERPDDWAELHRLGTVMSAAQGSHAYKVRQLSRWGFFFRAHGSEIDHMYGKYGTLSFLIELTRSGLNPLRPHTFRQHFRWYNPIRPVRHTTRGVRALRSLVHTLDWEGRPAPHAGPDSD